MNKNIFCTCLTGCQKWKASFSFQSFPEEIPQLHTPNSSLLTPHAPCQGGNFCTKFDPWQKTQSAKKWETARTVSFLFMWTKIEYPQFTPPVENPCGKTCGECGKLRVFNRYSAPLDFHHSLWKPCISICIICGLVAEPLCYVAAGKQIPCGKRERKSLQNVKNRCQNSLWSLPPHNIFVKNR